MWFFDSNKKEMLIAIKGVPNIDPEVLKAVSTAVRSVGSGEQIQVSRRSDLAESKAFTNRSISMVN